jgi:hypothetical protein
MNVYVFLVRLPLFLIGLFFVTVWYWFIWLPFTFLFGLLWTAWGIVLFVTTINMRYFNIIDSPWYNLGELPKDYGDVVNRMYRWNTEYFGSRARSGLWIVIILIVLAGLGIAGIARLNYLNHPHITPNTNAPNAYPSYLPGKGTLALYDPLIDNSEGNDWYDNGYCSFTYGNYQASETTAQMFQTCTARNTNFTDFAYEVQMEIINGYGGGIIFRADNTSSQFYYWRISMNGTYSLLRYVDSEGTHAKTLKTGSISAFHIGLNQQNLIAVVAKGNKINLYINKHFLISVKDATYSSGQIGMTAESTAGDLTEVLYSNATVWNL